MTSGFTRIAAFAAGAAIGTMLLFGTARAQQWTEESIRTAFAEADVNRDGYVDVDEFVGRSVLLFQQADANHDGLVVPSEAKNVSPKRFKNADRNGDGRLSLGEAAGAKLVDFFEMDTSKDGVVTIEELLAYEPLLAATSKK